MAGAAEQPHGSSAEGNAANGGTENGGIANGSATEEVKFQFSLSFTGKKAVARKPAAQDARSRQGEQVLSIGTNGVETARSESLIQGGQYVIPKLENTFQTGKGKPRFLPPASDKPEANGDKFEAAAPEGPKAPVQYGLEVRGKNAEAGQKVIASGRDWELQTYRADVEKLPGPVSLDAYEALPVEEFGRAMMLGMGYREGRAVGKRDRPEIKPIEYVMRPGLLGLGAAPAPPKDEPHRKRRMGEPSQPKKDMVYLTSDGRVGHVKPIDGKLVERPKQGVHAGKKMRVVAGAHSGLVCEVVALAAPPAEGGSARAVVRVEPSGESVTVRCKELGELWEEPLPEERGPSGEAERREKDSSRHRSKEGKDKKEKKDKKDKKERKEKRKRREKRERGSDDDRDDEGGSLPASSKSPRTARPSASPRSSPPAASPSPPPAGPAWLAPHIRVRIVDKALGGARFYLKKGVIVDVAQPTLCDVRVDDGGELVRVRQAQVETVLPRGEGAAVLVVAGPARGERARLLKRNADAQAAAVQLASDGSIVKVAFDEVAEYVGSMDEEY